MVAIPALTKAGSLGSGKPVDVTIVGAGLSGLYTAILLEDAGMSVRILEGNSRIGGRVYTMDHIEGKPEAGGTEVGAGYARIRAMISRIGGLPMHKWLDTFELDFALDYKGKLMNVDSWSDSALNTFTGVEKSPPMYGPFGLSAPYMAAGIPLLKHPDSWLGDEAAQLDIPFSEYLKQQGASQEAIDFIGRDLPSGSADSYSALWQFRNLRTQGMMGGVDGLERISTGSSRLIEGMRNLVKGDVILDAHVVSIDSSDAAATVTTVDGQVFKSRYVVSTLPLTILRNIHISPLMPTLQTQAIQQIPYDDLIYVFMNVDAPYWESDDMPGSIWSTDPRISRVFHVGGQDGVEQLIVKVPGSQKTLSDEVIMAKAQAALHDIRPSTKGKVRPVAVANWSASPWLQGHNPYRLPGQIARFGNIHSEAHGRVHFAGEHTAVANLGMEAAMESAERAALEIMQRV